MARKAVTTRRAAGPADQSRGTGQRVPTSAAAESPPPFYNAEDTGFGTALSSHVADLRTTAVDVSEDLSADQDVGASALGAERGAGTPTSSYDEDLARVAELRRGRRTLGTLGQKLALEPRRGYHRHWFNDTAGRIDEAVAAGWSHVKAKDGKPTRYCVGTGRDRGALFAYAMEIPLVFWQEDQDAKHEAAGNVMDNLKRSAFRAEKGSMKPEDRGTFYDPTESGSPISIAKR